MSSKVQVRIFDDRLEVWGCGPLPDPLTVEDLKKKHKSILRNPSIGRCFFLAKYIEGWGTGTNRIIEKCVERGLPEPLFEEVTESLVVTFGKRLTEKFLKERGLNERQIQSIEYLREKGKIKRNTYCDLFGI